MILILLRAETAYFLPFFPPTLVHVPLRRLPRVDVWRGPLLRLLWDRCCLIL